MKHPKLLMFSLGITALGTASCEDTVVVDHYDYTTPECGNFMLEENEICDGNLFADTAACPDGLSLPHNAYLECSPDCQLITEACTDTSHVTDNEEPSIPLCGNGILDEGEDCDGDQLGPQAICLDGSSLPTGSAITCNDDCTLDTSACKVPEKTCGNDQIDPGEACDGTKFASTPKCPAGTSLETGKAITCKSDCTLDTSACKEPEKTCGNDQIDPGEACDGTQFASTPKCPAGTSLETGKAITCKSDCTLDTSACKAPTCGNGTIDSGEACDGTKFASTPKCPAGTVLTNGKAITCKANCTLDTSACKAPCGNGQIDSGEACDGTKFASTPKCPAGTVLTSGKAITCKTNCTLDTSACKAPCGNGQIDSGEACDGTKFAATPKCPTGKELPSGKAITCKANCTLDTSACVDPCVTTIEYGSTWRHSSDRTSMIDTVNGKVTWDGNCTATSDGRSYAELSNGWKPYFDGYSCLMSINYKGNCGVDNVCKTRVKYGPNWKAAPGNTTGYDDVKGVVTWNGSCSSNRTTLSNGWTPNFNGNCQIALRYTQCGGLFTNPVIATNMPDPGVFYENGTYYLVGTSGHFTMYTSTDLVTWKKVGASLPTLPTWASKDFWAPEIHKIGSKYFLYYSARNASTNEFCLGAATATTPKGPYTDKGTPLHCKSGMGIIDINHFQDTDGKHYILWKDDGNAKKQKTPIFIQEVSSDGTKLVGTPTEILTNTLTFEGSLVEGPWLVKHGSYYYLFYSSNGYASSAYNISVARSTSLKGPYTKKGSPILSSYDYFQGPGHGSVLQSPSGEWFHIYHTWVNGYVGYNTGGPGRIVNVDRITWIDDWPMSYAAPNRRSQPVIR